jgi:hypothetical protein
MDSLVILPATFASMPKDEASSLMKKACTPKTKATLVEGRLLSYSLLCQISVFTGNILQLHPMMIRYVATDTSLSLSSLSKLLVEPSNDLLLLLSGTYNTQGAEILCGFGVHIVKTSHHRSETFIRTMFQYMPSHRVFWSHPEITEQPIDLSEESDGYHLGLKGRFTESRKSRSRSCKSIVSKLMLHQTTGAATFNVPEIFLFHSTASKLTLKDLELVEMDKTTVLVG